MDPITTLGLATIGERVANRVIGVFDGSSSAPAKAATATSFDSALANASAANANPYSGLSAADLAKTLGGLEKQLSSNSDVKEFTGGKDFRVLQKNGGYAIRRADGEVWQLPAGSEVAKQAESLAQCHVAQDNARGVPTTGMRSEWTVSAGADSASLLKAV